MSNSPFLYPNVTSIPQTQSDYRVKKEVDAPDKGEFDRVFDEALSSSGSKIDLNQVKQPLKFSAHAAQRLKDRKIALDPATMAKVNDAVDRAQAKGVEDTLVLTPNAALIVSVKNRTVVTALDRNALEGNVFTNIDGAVII